MPTDVSATDFLPAAAGPNSDRGAGRGEGDAVRRAAFVAVAAFILLGPAPGQLFGLHSPMLREWVMFSGVGTGIPKGHFIVREYDKEVSRHTPLDAAGLEAYPTFSHYQFEARIWSAADLGRFAAPLCGTLPPDHRLDFEGFVGTRNGWFAFPNADICAAAVEP